MSQGNFFAIGSEEFNKACELGLNTAVAFITLARGTGRDNATTKWSALSVFKYTGMAQRRATSAILQLAESGLLEILKAGKSPRYKLAKSSDEDSLIWLPNEVVEGVDGRDSPLCRLREAGDLDLLHKYILLYSEQDLDSDFGISRKLVRGFYDREDICTLGLFKLFGFNAAKTNANNGGLFDGYQNEEDADGNQGPWVVLNPLIKMGLIERGLYMVESDKNHDSEITYPLNRQVHDSHEALIEALREDPGRNGFAYKADSFEYVGLARSHVKDASLIAIYRLRFRPKTGKTARWYALEMERSESIVEVIQHLIRAIEMGGNLDGNVQRISG